MQKSQDCPLCGTPNVQLIAIPMHRQGYNCSHCKLIYVDKEYLLENENEKSRYLLHENSIEDVGYVQFLNQAIEPVLSLLTPEMQGLDFGCGPGPTLSKLLALKGLQCDDYDPFFFPLPLKEHYDFIFATECFEHFHEPGKELVFLDKLLKNKGLLVVMTDPIPENRTLHQWGYAHDPTHVSLYSPKTMEHIAHKMDWELLPFGNYRVFVFRKKNG